MSGRKTNPLKRGFTLVELMIVIAIIGVLSSIVLINITTARAKARDTRRMQDARQIVLALENYRNDKGRYPCSAPFYSNEANYLKELVDGKYLPTKPVDPINSDPYRYMYASYKSAPGSTCGQYVEVNYDKEASSTPCVNNGAFVPLSNPEATHCHIILPDGLPVPTCVNKWEFPSGHGSCIPQDTDIP